MYDLEPNMQVDSGNLLVDLMFPNHVVDYIYKKDRDMFLTRWTREIYPFTKINSNSTGLKKQMFLPSGSRTSSLRTPFITVFGGGEQRVIVNDMDLMVTKPELLVGCSEGPLHLEFIPDPINIGYGKIQKISGGENMPNLFQAATDGDGNKGKYLSGKETIEFTLKENPEFIDIIKRPKVGPSYERTHVSTINASQDHITKADIVASVMGAKDYYKEDIEAVMANSSWPSEVKESVISLPVLFVAVAPKHIPDDGITWRCSYSMHELVIARSLDLEIRQIYMVIKFTINYLLANTTIPQEFNDKKFSSYLIMNAFFSFCDLDRPRDWSKKKMRPVQKFLQYLTEMLKMRHLPQYFFPRNNLIKDATPEWSDFYSGLLSFADEKIMVKFLLDAQYTWRMPHFERPIKAHWSGEELTLVEMKHVLLNITLDALINLELVRVVQSLWTQIEIFQSFIRLQDASAEHSSPLSLETDFWEETWTALEASIHEGKVSRGKYVSLLKLTKEMIPDWTDRVCAIQAKLVYLTCDPEEAEKLGKYFEVTYRGHGEIVDCKIRFGNDHITLDRADEPQESYVFPYTEHLLLYSKPFIYFLFCGPALKRLPSEKVQSQIDTFLEQRCFSPELQRHPMLKLLKILWNAFCNEPFVFHDLGNYMLPKKS